MASVAGGGGEGTGGGGARGACDCSRTPAARSSSSASASEHEGMLAVAPLLIMHAVAVAAPLTILLSGAVVLYALYTPQATRGAGKNML
eukprot:2836767-Pleurochrysis_carterae.AAC.2